MSKVKAIVPALYDLPHTGLSFLEYYSKHNVYHPGQDFNKGYGNADLGNKIVCPVNGEVEYVSPKPTWRNGQNGGLGLFLVIYHSAYGRWTRHVHCNEVKVKKGDSVHVGEEIATVGNTGTTYAHLHFEVFGEVVWNIIKKHWRKYAWYPSGKSKAWVAEHYEDPLKWIESINEVDELEGWRVEAEEYAKEIGIKDVEGFLKEWDGHKVLVAIKKSHDSDG